MPLLVTGGWRHRWLAQQPGVDPNSKRNTSSFFPNHFSLISEGKHLRVKERWEGEFKRKGQPRCLENPTALSATAEVVELIVTFMQDRQNIKAYKITRPLYILSFKHIK